MSDTRRSLLVYVLLLAVALGGYFAYRQLVYHRVPSAGIAIGKIAPDIETEDLNGVMFKLSDYRGKVVVLDFWGDW